MNRDLIQDWKLFAGTMVLAASMLGSCSARRGEPVAGPLALDAREVQGQRIFMKNCYQCHPGGDAGLGPSINDKPLPNFMIRLQVRHGYGAMPAFSKTDIRDDDLDALLQYLSTLKSHG
jgi:mono/diheme cytochrome c family protein